MDVPGRGTGAMVEMGGVRVRPERVKDEAHPALAGNLAEGRSVVEGMMRCTYE